MRNSLKYSAGGRHVSLLLAFGAVLAFATSLVQATEYFVRADGAVSPISGAVNVSFNQSGQRGGTMVRVWPGYSFDPATRTVVVSTPAYYQDTLYHITTIRRNALSFTVAGGATLVVQPVSVSQPVMPDGQPGVPPPAPE